MEQDSSKETGPRTTFRRQGNPTAVKAVGDTIASTMNGN